MCVYMIFRMSKVSIPLSSHSDRANLIPSNSCNYLSQLAIEYQPIVSTGIASTIIASLRMI